MTEHQLLRHALAQLLEKFVDGKPDLVLFTSFNFSAAFFENNVLPLLCGNPIEQFKNAPLPRDALNRQLEGIKVLVACDHSAQPEPKSNLRYGLLPVGLNGGRFHPKIILLAGSGADGKPALWLSVSSANLSYSGWGANREVVGITPVKAQHARELAPLLQWLRQQAEHRAALASGSAVQEEGDSRQVLDDLLDALRTQRLPDEQAQGLPDLHLALPPAALAGHPALLTALLGGQRWDSASVISPYWSGVAQLLQAAGTGTAFQLVPSIAPSGEIKFPLPPEPGNLDYARFAEEPQRYTHAKAMLLSGPGRKALCIGSANFTRAALLPDGQHSLANVEAMLRYQVGADYSWSTLLTRLDAGTALDSEDADEGAPPLPPFLSDVVYDWDGKCFHCSITPAPGRVLGQVTLEIGGRTLHCDFNTAQPQRATVEAALRHAVRSYKLIYTDGQEPRIHVGLVTQLNGGDEQLDYLPKPRLDKVLALLHGLVPGKRQRRSDTAGGSHPGEESTDPDGEDQDDAVFDFFSFFVATDKMRHYYQDPRHRAEDPMGSGGTSIFTLYRAVMSQPDLTPEAKIGRYVQLAEVQETLACLRPLRPEQPPQPRPEDIERELARLSNEITPLLQQSPAWRTMFPGALPDPATFLAWFRQELTIKADMP